MNDEELIKASRFHEEYRSKNRVSKVVHGVYNELILKTILFRTDFGDNNPSDRAIVMKSEISGLGVFAKKNISKQDIITFYPAHYVIVPDGVNENGNIIVRAKLSEAVISRGYTFDIKFYDSYSTKINSYYSIAGDPRIHNRGGFIGHMCNDGGMYHLTEKNDEAKHEYNTMKENICNADIVVKPYINELAAAIIASRDIKSGEEILVPYGYKYWIEHNKRKTKNQQK